MKGIRPIAPAAAIAMLSWTIAVAAAWLAVGNQPWAQTLLIAAVGGLYLFFPPSGVFPRALLALFGLLLLLATTAFLPVDWVGAAVHKPFLDHGIILPSTLSPQPWLSLEDITLLFATLLWAWNCFESKLVIGQREFLITSYLVAMGLVAAVTIVHGTSLESKLPAFLLGVGQFENRNQTGDLLVMGGILSFARGISGLSKQNNAGVFWILMTGLFMAATIRNGSRAAVGLFFVGLLLAFSLMVRVRHRHGFSHVAALLIFLGGMLVFAFQSEELQKRFQHMFEGERGGRFPIYQDAISMVMRDPWCGVGLGNFEGVFNTQRFYSAQRLARCLHPESDWLWIAAELGVIGVLIGAAMVVLTFRIYLRRTPFPGLASASAAVALLFLIHSFFDVGGHRLGTIWSCLYLVSLGAFRPASLTDGRVPRIVLRLAGVFLLVVTGFRIQSMNVQPLMPTQASLTKVEESLVPQVPLPEQKKLLDRSIGWAPLDWSLYYHRALVCVQLPGLSEESDADFNRSLYLEQNSVDLPIAVGEACRHSDFQESLLAWRALLQRVGPGPVREGLFQNLYWYPKLDVNDRLAMTTLADGDPNLEAISVMNEYPAEFDWLLQNLLKSNPSLKGVAPAILRKLFDRWVEVGNVEQFMANWPLHPEWHTAGWRAYAKGLAKEERFKEAVATVLQFMPAPQMPSFHASEETLDEMENQYRDNPQDAFMGIRLYFTQVSSGLNDQAMTTLMEVAKLPNPPAYIRYLLAKNLAVAGQDEAAWKVLNPLLNEL